jgi:heptosyltransferase-2
VKILVRGTNWIGDAVMSIPALRRLRASFPESYITLLTRSWAEGIFRDADFLDDIIAVSADKSRVASIVEQSRAVRKSKFDLAVVLPNSFESALAAKLSGAGRTFGYATDGRGFLLTDKIGVPEWKNSRHEIFYYLNLIEAVENAFGRNAEQPELAGPILPVSGERKSAALKLLSGFGVDPSRPTVALAAGSKNSRAKRWGVSKFGGLADLLVGNMNVNVILVGAPEEAEISAEVRAASRAPLIDITGKTNLADAAAILSVSDLLISNDMGLAHLAPAGGTPAIVIFGPTNSATTGPFDGRSSIMRVDVECSPCMLRDCPIDHRCMTRISVDSVFERAAEYLNRDGR